MIPLRLKYNTATATIRLDPTSFLAEDFLILVFSFKDVTIFMIFNRVNKYSMNVEKSSKSSCVNKFIRDFIWFASLLWFRITYSGSCVCS